MCGIIANSGSARDYEVCGSGGAFKCLPSLVMQSWSLLCKTERGRFQVCSAPRGL